MPKRSFTNQLTQNQTDTPLNEKIKNPYFWIGLIGILITAMGGSMEELTTWGALFDLVINAFSNPATIIGMVMAVLGVFSNYPPPEH